MSDLGLDELGDLDDGGQYAAGWMHEGAGFEEDDDGEEGEEDEGEEQARDEAVAVVNEAHLDDLVEEEDEESEDLPVVSRQRKTGRTQSAQGQWDPIIENVSLEALTEKMQTIARVELSSALEWGSGIRKPTMGFNSKGVARRELRCPFRGPANCNCPALLRVTEHEEDGSWTLERKRGAPHADHTQSNKKRGLPKHIACNVTSPTKMKLPAAKLKQVVREKFGAVSTDTLKQITSVRRRKKMKEQDQIVPRDQRSTHGGLQLWVDAHSRQALESKGTFGPHTAYVCGEPRLDSETGLITIAYSTENLLLNGYRQGQFGLPSILQVDCTHRLVLEGHLCMLFGTVDVAQHFHAIGYGLCSSEDEYTHSHVFRCLKKEMERLVAERGAAGASI